MRKLAGASRHRQRHRRAAAHRRCWADGVRSFQGDAVARQALIKGFNWGGGIEERNLMDRA